MMENPSKSFRIIAMLSNSVLVCVDYYKQKIYMNSNGKIGYSLGQGLTNLKPLNMDYTTLEGGIQCN
jgi:hypothetical protein